MRLQIFYSSVFFYYLIRERQEGNDGLAETDNGVDTGNPFKRVNMAELDSKVTVKAIESAE